MHVDPYIVLGSAVVGLLVGLTGAGGGALMTPMLILLFGIKPSTAISSDLVAAVVMRPFGAAVHMRKGTVNFRLVGWMVCGSVPMAFVGAYLLHLLGDGQPRRRTRSRPSLGAALLIGAAAMVLRYGLDRRSGQRRRPWSARFTVRPLPPSPSAWSAGSIVGMTSVGSGSLMIVLLLFLTRCSAAGQLVGTDLTQAVPLTAGGRARRAGCSATSQFAVTDVDRHRQRARPCSSARCCPRGRPTVHPAGHHLRDLRLRAQVRRRRHHRAGLDPRPRAARRAADLAGHRPALARQRTAVLQTSTAGTAPPGVTATTSQTAI